MTNLATFSLRQLYAAKDRLEENFSKQFRDGHYGEFTRIVRDGHPHPFLFILACDSLLVYLTLLATPLNELAFSEITYPQAKGATMADAIGPGSHAGFLIHFLSADEIWYLPGKLYYTYRLAKPGATTIPLERVRECGIQLHTEKRNVRCKHKDRYDIPAFFQALRLEDQKRKEQEAV